MRKRYALVGMMVIACSRDCDAQAYGTLDMNDVRFRIFSNGFAGSTPSNPTLRAFEVPQGSGTSVLSGSGIWLSGVNSSNQLHTAGWLYSADTGQDFWPGPLRIDGTATTTQANSDAYDHVWVVSREQIAQHLAYYACLSDPDCDVDSEFPNGYSIPSEILDWPAMGDVADGYSMYVAPFYDFNMDGAYDPAAGDAPCILGDQAFFLVFNDRLGPHTASFGQSLGVEVQVMGFVYAGADPALDQTVFLRYHVINRGTLTLTDFQLGYFNDIDVGCSDDDFFGTDPSRNLHYFYNWQDVDVDCLGSVGFGDQPPAIGMTLIKGPLLDADGQDNPVADELPAWNGYAFDDGIVDNERLGLSRSICFRRESPNPATTDPSQPLHWANYMKGIWKDGVPMSYGGNGYSTAPDVVPARYMYPGDDDPIGAGTSGQVMPPWSEIIPTPTSPDRRGVMSSGPMTLEPGEHMDLLYAYVYARAGSGGATASVTALQARVDSIRAYSQTLPIWDVFEESGFSGQCTDYAFLGINERSSERVLRLYPVPASTSVQLDAPKELIGALLTLRDATGRVILQQRVLPDRNTIDVSRLAPGLYTCEALSRNARFAGRLVKE